MRSFIVYTLFLIVSFSKIHALVNSSNNRGQEATSIIEVIDEFGNPIHDAKIELMKKDQRLSFVNSKSINGKAALIFQKKGAYNLSISKTGFADLNTLIVNIYLLETLLIKAVLGA